MYRDYYLKRVKDDLQIDQQRERLEDRAYVEARKNNSLIFGSMLNLK